MDYDNCHKNKDRIYRIITRYKYGSSFDELKTSNSFLVKNALLNDFPEIEKATRILPYGSYGDKQLVKVGNELIAEESIKLVDNEFFEIFTIEILNGSGIKPFESNNSILLSEKASNKYFGKSYPVGEIITVKNNSEEINFEVVGVFKDIPTNSSFQAEMIGNIGLVENKYENRGWLQSGIETYFLVKKNASVKTIANKLLNFGEKYHKGFPLIYMAQNLNDVYFKSGQLSRYNMPQGNLKHIYIFSIISILIILIASINYIIISTAKGMTRNIEVGIKKVFGASTDSIMKMITIESIIFMLMVFPLSLLISEFSLPLFNSILGKKMEISYFENWKYLTSLIGLTMIIGLFSGLYISFYLSKFQPTDIIKRKFTNRYNKDFIQKGMLVIQLITFIVLFIFAGIIYSQLKYIQNKDLGYSASNILVVNPPYKQEYTDVSGFVEELKKISDIESISLVSSGIFAPMMVQQSYYNPNNPADTINLDLYFVDYDYSKLFQLNYAHGEWFGDKSLSREQIILNQTAAKKLEFDYLKDEFVVADGMSYKVVGIVQDFNTESLHKKIDPIGIKIRNNRWLNQIAIKYNTSSDLNKLVKNIETKWNIYGPKWRFDYYFWEDKLNSFYRNDINFGNAIGFYAILTIIIALLGLFGYSIFMSYQRSFEVGIRKIYGASSREISIQFFKEYLLLLIISNTVAWPVAYYLASNWLQEFAYRTNITINIFIEALFVSIVVVLLIVGYNIIRTANRNPVDVLKQE